MQDAPPSPHRLNELLAKTTRAAYAASTVEGPDVFGRLAEQLAEILAVGATMIATAVAERPGLMLARSTWLDGGLLRPFEYELAQTPCRSVIGRDSRFVASGVHGEFAPGTLFHAKGFDSYAARSLLDGSGRQLGLIVAMDRAPMTDAAVTEAVLQIFAVRASAELERERGQAALRASEASYRAIFEANEDAIFIHDWASGAILDVSPKAAELYGYPREALRRMRVGDISANVPPYTESDAVARIEQAKRGAGPVRFEWQARHRDGRLMWNEVTLKRAEIAGESRVLAFVRDITESRQAEKRLRDSEERYRLLFETESDAIVLVDVATLRLIDANRAAEALWGYGRDALLALTVADLSAEPDQSRDSIQSPTGQVHIPLRMHRRRDGTVFPVEITANRLVLEGRPTVVAAVRDITERKRAEQALLASEEQYRTIFNASVDAMVLWDSDLRRVDINPAYERLFGLTREQVLAGVGFEHLPIEYTNYRRRLVQRTLAGERCHAELESVRRDGTHLSVEVRTIPIQHRGQPHVLAIVRDITERKKAEDALRKSEEQYRAIFNASVDGLLLWDPDHRVVDVNDAFLSLHGYRREELLGASEPGFIPVSLQEQCAALLPKIVAGEPCHIEATSRRRNGEDFDVEIHGLPIRYQDRPHALIVLRDISQRKEQEEDLRRSEGRLRATVEAALDAVIGMDAAGNIIEFNAAAERCFGHHRADVLGKSLAELVIPRRHRHRHNAGMDRYLRTGEGPYLGSRVEVEALRAGGSEFPAELAIGVARSREGPIFIGYLRDITERKQAEGALRASEEQYRSIFNASADALVLRDADFRIVDVNATYESMTGLSREEALGADRVLANPPEVNESIRPLHRRALAGDPIVLETQLVRRDGARYELELRGVPIQHRGAPHVLYMGRDITARRRAEDQQRELQAQLRQVQKMEAIGQLTGGIAHDFNNILAAIMGYVGLALERPATATDGKLADYLEQAEVGCRRARDLIQQMLAFSRGRQGERRATPLSALVDESLRLLRATFPSSIALEVESADDGAVAEVDPVQLQQVLLNLGINARDATGSAGRIRFGVRRQAVASDLCASCGQSFSGDFHRLWVTDSGPGIPPQLRDRIFEPFFSTKAPGRGTGMGLATVHRIVHDHGGHLLVESNHGTRFDVLLPADPAASASALAVASPTAPRRALLRGRVLLVDDEESVLGFMRELLQSWGLEVVAVRQALAARDLLAAAEPGLDLLITDQTMPELGGVDLAHAARTLRPNLPVLLYSGHADLIDVAALKQAGIRRVLRKPLEPAELRSAIEECLARS